MVELAKSLIQQLLMHIIIRQRIYANTWNKWCKVQKKNCNLFVVGAEVFIKMQYLGTTGLFFKYKFGALEATALGGTTEITYFSGRRRNEIRSDSIDSETNPMI